MRAVFLLCFVLAGCSSPEKTWKVPLSHARAQQTANQLSPAATVKASAEPPFEVASPFPSPPHAPVWFNTYSVAKPATLKGSIRETVSGEYAYADLETLLAFVGKVENIEPEVHRVEFFHGFAASVSVGYYNLYCAAVSRHEWRLIGFNSVLE